MIVLSSQQNYEEGTEISRTPPASSTEPPPTPRPNKVVPLLQLRDQHGHTILTRSPGFAFGFTVDVLDVLSLDNCYKDTRPPSQYHTDSFTALKLLCALPAHPAPRSVLRVSRLLQARAVPRSGRPVLGCASAEHRPGFADGPAVGLFHVP